ncbi:unnamed protein product [Gadus morhua 'NCC']
MGGEYDRLLAPAQEVTNPLTPFHVGCQFQFGSLLRGDSLGPQVMYPQNDSGVRGHFLALAKCGPGGPFGSVVNNPLCPVSAAHGAAHGEHGEVDFLRLFHRIGAFRASCLRRSSMNRMEFNPSGE